MESSQSDKRPAAMHVTGPVTVSTPSGVTYDIPEDVTLSVPVGSTITYWPTETAGQELPTHLEKD